ncbi:MAG: DUF7305 domain-containing protein [Armatimonadota bacterium]
MSERGFALPLVLATFLLVGVVGLGALSVVMSDTHGAVAHQLAMQATNVAEAGLNYAAAQLVARAAGATPTDEAYRGEPDDLALPATGGVALGMFSVSVKCAHPRGAMPPACKDDASTAAIDEQDLRVIVSTGFVPGRPGRARRQLEATVRRYVPAPGDAGNPGICGRDGVDLAGGTEITADVGSNGDVVVESSQRGRAAVRGRTLRAPSFAPTIEAASGTSTTGLTGAYSWRVTFLNTQGQESGGSPPTPVVVLTGHRALLTNIPLGDSPIVRRRVYRTLQDSPRGPWFLVGEIQDSSEQDYIDHQPDEALRWRMPGGIGGNVTAARTVLCTKSCVEQIDGYVRSGVREVICPNFLLPLAQPGKDPAPNPIIQSATHQTMRFAALRAGEGEVFTIQTLSTLDAQLHIHVSELRLEQGAALVITGPGSVYFYVSGTFGLSRDAVFGAIDFDGHLVRPSDRLQVFTRARDPSFLETGAASVRLERDNKVSALIFAPNANILIDRASAFSGALYGKYVRISRSTGIFLDPVEGLGSEKSGVRPTPFQYVLRWYDNPNPGP